MNDCQIRGCRNLQTVCKDCGRTLVDRVLIAESYESLQKRIDELEKDQLRATIPVGRLDGMIQGLLIRIEALEKT